MSKLNNSQLVSLINESISLSRTMLYVTGKALANIKCGSKASVYNFSQYCLRISRRAGVN